MYKKSVKLPMTSVTHLSRREKQIWRSMAELNPNTKMSKQNKTVKKAMKLDRGKGGKDVITKVKESIEGILKTKGHKCDICGHFAKRYWDVSRHCGEAHAERCGFHNFICHKCEYKTPRRKHMINHIESNCLSKTKQRKGVRRIIRK